MTKILIASLLASFLPMGFINSPAFAYDIKSGALPSYARVQNATHYFTVNVPKTGLSSLTIQIPEGIKVNGEIKVDNQYNQPINSNFSIKNNQVIIDFLSPVSDSDTLTISLKNVGTTGYSENWIYRIYGTMAKLNETIPLGSIQVQTYD
jgi:hypothetical protein